MPRDLFQEIGYKPPAENHSGASLQEIRETIASKKLSSTDNMIAELSAYFVIGVVLYFLTYIFLKIKNALKKHRRKGQRR